MDFVIEMFFRSLFLIFVVLGAFLWNLLVKGFDATNYKDVMTTALQSPGRSFTISFSVWASLFLIFRILLGENFALVDKFK